MSVAVTGEVMGKTESGTLVPVPAVDPVLLRTVASDFPPTLLYSVTDNDVTLPNDNKITPSWKKFFDEKTYSTIL